MQRLLMSTGDAFADLSLETGIDAAEAEVSEIAKIAEIETRGASSVALSYFERVLSSPKLDRSPFAQSLKEKISARRKSNASKIQNLAKQEKKQKLKAALLKYVRNKAATVATVAYALSATPSSVETPGRALVAASRALSSFSETVSEFRSSIGGADSASVGSPSSVSTDSTDASFTSPTPVPLKKAPFLQRFIKDAVLDRGETAVESATDGGIAKIARAAVEVFEVHVAGGGSDIVSAFSKAKSFKQNPFK